MITTPDKKNTSKKTSTVVDKGRVAKSSALKVSVGSGKSATVDLCQICGVKTLESVIFLGYLPPVNTMPLIGTRPEEAASYPAELLRCTQCQLFQLGLVVDPLILFPPSYPYTSGTTKILRENFAELYKEVMQRYPLAPTDLVVDIGSNDGTLLSNFHQGGHRVLGIEPTDTGKLAVKRGIPTITSFFNASAVKTARSECGQAKVVTAANVFAHIDGVHDVVEGITDLLTEDGIFVNESHYLPALLRTLQYDTIYHEHLRYYSVTALQHLLNAHGLEIIHTKEIPTHGGSIRVYSARTGKYPIQESVQQTLKAEANAFQKDELNNFRQAVVQSKLDLFSLLKEIKSQKKQIVGIGAPSRASTLVNYVGLDDGIIDSVLEVPGSYKIGKYMPGTLIPVLSEEKLFTDQPAYAILFSWHIADELMPKLKAKGFRGDFIIPLPEPHIVKNGSVHDSK